MDEMNKQANIIYKKGQRVGQYEIVEDLKETRLGHTYQGQRVYQNTQVMLEIFQVPLLDELKDGFLAQSQTLKKLEHPNILRLRDAGMHNHYPFLVSDYGLYRTLREVCPQGSVQPLSLLLAYLKQVAAALQYAHSQLILHGDIRPENIWLDRNNNVLLWDFRIEAIVQNRDRLKYQNVRAMDQVNAYTAPEQLQDHAIPASDQYSLAILVYELLCGSLPFTGSSLDVAYQQLHSPVPSLRQKAPGVSPGIENTILKALEKEPGKRFADTQAFVQALEQEQSGSPRVATPSYAPAQPTGVIAPPVVTAWAAEPPAFQPPTSPAGPSVTPQTPVYPPQQQPQPQQAPVHLQQPQQAPVHLPPPQQQPQPQVYLPSPGGSPQIASYPTQQAIAYPAQQPTQQANLQPPAITQLPSQGGPPPHEPSPLARRRDSNTVTRRVFAVGLVGVAVVGGAGGWYYFSQRLKGPASPTATTPGSQPPATQTTINNGKVLIFTGHLASVNALAWSPDGTQIASASDDTTVQIWDSTSGQRKIAYSGHTEEVAAVGWSPDGRSMASGGEDRTVQLWSPTTGVTRLTYKVHTDRVNGVSWSKNSLTVASGSDDKTVQTWSAVNGETGFIFQGHTAGVLCVAWQPNNTSVASGSWDGTVRDWATVQHGNHFNAGDIIFNYGGHGQNEVNALAWSPNNSFVASAGADQTVQISNGVNGSPVLPFFTDQRNNAKVNPILSLAWSPNGATMASGDNDGNVYVWNVATRKTTFIYRGHKGPVNAVAFSPDGTKIASASSDNTVQVWQPQ